MVENTRGMQECKRLEGLVRELADQVRLIAASSAEQMRMMMANNAGEMADFKQTLLTKVCQPTGSEETSHMSGEPMSHPERRWETGLAHNSYTTSIRQTKVDFPRFTSDDLRGWLYKCETFFELDGTPWDMKVKVAAVHLEGRALQWHQMYMQKRVTRDTPHWEEYVQALHIRFGVTVFEDSMAELMTLRQTGELEECLEAFDSLLGRVCLLEEYAISCLLAAIRDGIANVVRMHRSKSLLEAYALARQQNINLKHTRGRNFAFPGAGSKTGGAMYKLSPHVPAVQKPTAISGILPSPKPQALTYKNNGRGENLARRLTSAEIDEKRRQGICFWCDEKFTFLLKCRSKQLHMVTIESVDDMPTDEPIQVPPEVDEELEAVPQLSLCALTGEDQELSCNTMRVVGKVKRDLLNILVDSGSTHNFLDPHRARRMGYEIEQITPVWVTVANGDRLVCREICRKYSWRMHNYEFQADVFLLRLGGCDMVLGVEWLVTLGDIVWNFQESTMRFTYGGHECLLQRTCESKQKEIEVHALEKFIQKSANSAASPMRYLVFTRWVSEVSCQSLQLQVQDNVAIKGELRELLQHFQDVFLEPKALPPE